MFAFNVPQSAGWCLGRRSLLHALVLALLAATLFTGAHPAYAQSLTANDAASLIAAINAANDEGANPGPDTITLLGDVTLTAVDNADFNGANGLPQIVSDITIAGDGHTLSRAAGAPAFRFFYVQSGAGLTLNGLTLQNGVANDPYHFGISGGGGIYSQGTLTVNNSTISGNTANNSQGGGIANFNNGTVTVNNSTISGNTANNDQGGGIVNNGRLTVNNSTISGNTAGQGGGIASYVWYAVTTLNRSLISGNNASYSGPEIARADGAVNADNYNLIGYGGDVRSSGFGPGTTDIVPSQALEQILNTTLQVNGSGPATLALVAGSPAIDAAGDGGFATDERGVARPQGAADDIGAFEWQAAAAAPNLNVEGAGVSLVNGDKINVPVKFAGNGSQIASVGFVLNYDTVCLSFAATDSNGDGIPDVVTGLPPAFAPSFTYNANNKLEVALYDDTQPISTFADGTLFTVQFTVNAACLPTAASPQKSMAVGFDASPAPSFGDPTSADVAGTTTDGTITLNYSNNAPTALALSQSSVDENSAAGTTVGTFSTTDPNSGESFTYNLVSGTGSDDNASFTITGNTLQTAAVFDYETKNSYTIRVRTTDSGGLYFEQSFTINVTNLNEAPIAVDDLVNPRTIIFLGGLANVIDVLANDIANGGTLSVASVTQPAAGQGSVTNNTTDVSYTAPQANGSASFTYQASNGYATSNSANVSLRYVANDQRGDCNGNGTVTAADFIGVVLEIFDTHNSAGPDGDPAWWLTYTGDYAGSPRGCDANGGGNPSSNGHYQASVTAADIICSVLIFFGHPCGGGVQAAQVTQTAQLTVADAQATPGNFTPLTVTINTGGNAIAAATFALDLDPAKLHFSDSDADEDGVPDAITLRVPPSMSKTVIWNATSHRLEVAVFGMSLPLPTLSDGLLATVQVQVAANATASTTPLALSLVSLSDPDGNDLPVTQADGTFTVQPGATRSGTIFLPLVVR